MVSSHKRFSIANRRTGDFTDFGPRRFLDENDVELVLGLKEGVYDEGVFANILRKNFDMQPNVVVVYSQFLYHYKQTQSAKTWFQQAGAQQRVVNGYHNK